MYIYIYIRKHIHMRTYTYIFQDGFVEGFCERRDSWMKGVISSSCGTDVMERVIELKDALRCVCM
jgi:hypothetical protein